MAQTTTTQMPAAVRTFYDRTLLSRALPLLVHDKFGQMRPIKMNSGDQIKFRRINGLDPATAVLTQGVTPAAVQALPTDITAELAQYGNLVKVTDMVEWTNQDKILTEIAIILGENAGESLDIVYRDVLAGGTNVRYANGVAGRSSVDNKISDTDLDIVIRALENNNAKHFTKMLKPNNGYNSFSVPQSYWAIIHPYVHYDLRNSVTDFIPVNDYASQSEVMEGEVGAYKNIRFISTTHGKVFADSGAAVGGGWYSTSAVKNDVFATLIFAKDAYGICPLSGHALENIRKPKGSGTDYLNQYSISGWKATTTIKILNDDFMYRIESAATA